MTFTHFIPRLLNKIGLLKWLNINKKISLNNSNLIIPIINKMGFNNLFLSEPWMSDIIKRIPINMETFIDVGVNLGQTLLKVKSIYPEINYIGFEPNPTCYFYVKELSKLNKFKNTCLIPVGLSKTTSLLNLNIFYDDADSSASIIQEFRPEQEIKNQILIPVFKLDEIDTIRKLSKISVLKIDVEGAELEVLEGAIEMIRQHKPVILIEILPVYKKENTFRLNRQEAIEQLLSAIGYKCYRIKKDQNDRLKNLELIKSIDIHNSIELSDYVFTIEELDINLRNCIEKEN